MRFDIVTLFPEMLEPVLTGSILKRAQTAKQIEVHLHNLRDYAEGTHKSVDDTPYGGGAGMVLRVDVMDRCLAAIKAELPEGRQTVLLLTPQGKRFAQPIAQDLAKSYDQITLICGHYEGFDERIRSLVDGQISIGDYVLTGGELPALVVVDAVTRLIPGVISEGSSTEESFSLTDEDGKPLLEYPHYTRPVSYKGQTVPEVLLSGHHAEIAKWRHDQAKKRVAK